MYGKHFQSMYTGSMVGSGAVVFSVWGYIVANTRQSDSSIELNPRLLASIIGEHVDKIEEAIKFLCAPDKHSRSKEEEGRRLVLEAPFLYRVVNAKKYNSIRDEDARREYQRVYMKEYRKKSKTALASVNSCKTPLTQEDVDVNEDVKAKTATTSAPLEKLPPIPRSTWAVMIYSAYPKKTTRKESLEEIEELIKDGVNPSMLLAKTKEFADSPQGKRQQFVLDPCRWFKRRRFEDDPAVWQREEDNGNGPPPPMSRSASIAVAGLPDFLKPENMSAIDRARSYRMRLLEYAYSTLKYTELHNEGVTDDSIIELMASRYPDHAYVTELRASEQEIEV